MLPDETSHSKPGILRYNRAREELMNLFWTIWSTEYVRQLPPWQGKAKDKIAVGSVALVGEDGCYRQQWPLAVVTKPFPGKDELVRAVKLKTAKSIVTRPIQRLHCLELSNDADNGDKVEPSVPERVTVIDGGSMNDSNRRGTSSEVQNTSRYGRVLRSVKRFEFN